MTQFLQQAANGSSSVMIVLNAADLKQVVSEMYQEQAQATAAAVADAKEKPTLTRIEAAEMLGVALSTLWKWAKSGYLVPVKIGNKVLYRVSDINKMMQQATAAAGTNLISKGA